MFTYVIETQTIAQTDDRYNRARRFDEALRRSIADLITDHSLDNRCELTVAGQAPDGSDLSLYLSQSGQVVQIDSSRLSPEQKKAALAFRFLQESPPLPAPSVAPQQLRGTLSSVLGALLPPLRTAPRHTRYLGQLGLPPPVSRMGRPPLFFGAGAMLNPRHYKKSLQRVFPADTPQTRSSPRMLRSAVSYRKKVRVKPQEERRPVAPAQQERSLGARAATMAGAVVIPAALAILNALSPVER
jgi:hypothetical protein